jgi:hypothetical protein
LKFALYILIFSIPTLCFAQVQNPYDTQDSISGFTGAGFYSRTLSNDETVKINQLVVPLLLTGIVKDNLNIRVYQTFSYARLESTELKKKPTLNGLENTKVRASFSLFEDIFRLYLGLSLPISKTEPDIKTTLLDNLLYNDLLQFGVIRITEGFDLDTGFAFAKSFGNLSLGLGAGYNLRGSYDRLSQYEKLVNYDPGDTLNATAGLQFLAGLATLRGKLLYIHFLTDKIDGNEVFKSGDEFSFIASASFKLNPLILDISLADTLKAESDEIQKGIIINNLYKNKLNGDISIALPLFYNMLIPNIQANMKGILDNGGMNDKVASFGGGLLLFLSENLALNILGNYMIGDTDSGETNISGFNLALNINYGF